MESGSLKGFTTGRDKNLATSRAKNPGAALATFKNEGLLELLDGEQI